MNPIIHAACKTTVSDKNKSTVLRNWMVCGVTAIMGFSSFPALAQAVSPIMAAMQAVYEAVPTSSPVAVTQNDQTRTVSVAGQANGKEVSVAGSEGPRVVSGVAAGSRPTDAVNLGQTTEMFNDVNRKIRKTERKADEGTAAAIAAANLPQAVLPGEKVVGVGGGTWSGESGYAVGVSAATDNGKWLLNGSVVGSSGGDVGAGVGVGYRWR